MVPQPEQCAGFIVSKVVLHDAQYSLGLRHVDDGVIVYRDVRFGEQCCTALQRTVRRARCCRFDRELRPVLEVDVRDSDLGSSRSLVSFGVTLEESCDDANTLMEMSPEWRAVRTGMYLELEHVPTPIDFGQPIAA